MPVWHNFRHHSAVNTQICSRSAEHWRPQTMDDTSYGFVCRLPVR